LRCAAVVKLQQGALGIQTAVAEALVEEVFGVSV
jgi:hypothetical protein